MEPIILNHEHFMQRCLQLAKAGLGAVAPNPMVGCVIVHNNIIVGEGYHIAYGGAHAEVNAINSVANQDVLSECTLYVNLEPCAHYGKTPPCANLIVSKKIKRVVIGSLDVYPLVAGQGVAILQQAGIEVMSPILEKECRHLNRRFYTWHQKKRPYIILKWAQSADGFMDKKRSDNERAVNWITTPATQQLVHLWRAQEQAVLVGDTTVVNDNPSLTVRLVQGKNPVRIIISPKLDFPLDSKVLLNEAPTFIFYGHKDLMQSKVNGLKKINGELKFFPINEEHFLPGIMEKLYEENIQSVLVEGGAYTLNEFIINNLWDEARVLTGRVVLHDGLLSPPLNSTSAKQFSSDQDEVNIFYNT